MNKFLITSILLLLFSWLSYILSIPTLAENSGVIFGGFLYVLSGTSLLSSLGNLLGVLFVYMLVTFSFFGSLKLTNDLFTQQYINS